MRRGTKDVTVKSTGGDNGVVALVYVVMMLWKVFYLVVIGFAFAGAFKAYSNANHIFDLQAKDMVLMDNVTDLDADVVMLQMDVDTLNTSILENSMKIDTLNMSVTQLDLKIDDQVIMLNTTLCAKIEDGDDNLQTQINALSGVGTTITDLQMKTLGNMMNITLLQDKDMVLMNQISAIESLGEMLSNATMDLNVTVLQALIDAMTLDGRVTMVEDKALQNMMDIMTLMAAGGGESIAGDNGTPLHVPQGAGSQFNILGGAAIDTVSAAASLTISSPAVTTASSDSGSATASSNTLNIVGAGSVSTSASGNTVTITGATAPITEVSTGVPFATGPLSGLLTSNPMGPTVGLQVRPYRQSFGMPQDVYWCRRNQLIENCGAWDAAVNWFRIGPQITTMTIIPSDSAFATLGGCTGFILDFLLCDGEAPASGNCLETSLGGVCAPIQNLPTPNTVFETLRGTIGIVTGADRGSYQFELQGNNVGRLSLPYGGVGSNEPLVIGAFSGTYVNL